MVNTVGSCKNKHWQKNWIPIKQSLSLSNKQKSLIIGSLLGDGTMRLGKGAIHANYKVEHGLAQKDYVSWKYKILKNLVFTEPKLSFRYKSSGEKYKKSWWFRTIRHPFLTKIYKVFYEGNEYKCGRKIVPKSIGKSLNPMALAVWIMDDGCYSRQKIDISTYAFRLSEIELLGRVLKNKFGIRTKFFKDRDKGYRMYFNIQETKNLIKIIYPYIIDSMRYKIGFYNPVTTSPLKRRELSFIR